MLQAEAAKTQAETGKIYANKIGNALEEITGIAKDKTAEVDKLRAEADASKKIPAIPGKKNSVLLGNGVGASNGGVQNGTPVHSCLVFCSFLPMLNTFVSSFSL